MEDNEKKGIIVFTKYSPYSAADTRIENYKGEEYKTESGFTSGAVFTSLIDVLLKKG